MQRRHFLALAPSVALGGCLTGPDQAIATVANDAKLIASGLQGVLVQLGNLNVAGLTPAILATVGSAVTNLQAVADAIAGVATNAAAQPLVQKIETYVNTIVSALAVLPLPPPISTALQAAAILLPIIEAAVGMVLPASTARAAKGLALTPDQARLVLAGSSANVVK